VVSYLKNLERVVRVRVRVRVGAHTVLSRMVGSHGESRLLPLSHPLSLLSSSSLSFIVINTYSRR